MGTESILKVCDNSGASTVKIVNFFKKRRNIRISFGSYLKVIVLKLDRKRKQRVNKKDKVIGFLIKSRKKTFNLYSYVKYHQSAMILLSNSFKPIGTRNFGVLGISFLDKKFMTKLLSLNVRVGTRTAVI